MTQIARTYSASISAVQRALVRMGVDRRSFSRLRSTPLSTDQEQEIIERFLAGESVNSLADEYHIGSKRLYQMVEGAGHVARRGPRKGPDHTWWKGGRTVTCGKGYVSVWMPDDHPFAIMRNHKNRVAEHRLVMAEAIGRPLRKEETVHHINNVKNDNRIENLQLMPGAHGRRMAYQCLNCGSMSVQAVELP